MIQFLYPGLLWWLAVLLPAITLLYFLKLRRQDQIISSTLLWQRSVYDLRVNAPFRMIRRNLLLLLQLLIATLLILALARPVWRARSTSGRRLAMVLDISASMATRDGPGGVSRLDAAKTEARALIDHLDQAALDSGTTDELCIVAAADRPRVLCGLTSDPARLRTAIDNLQEPQATGTDLAAAVDLALALTRVGMQAALTSSDAPIETAPRPADGEEHYEGKTPEAMQLRLPLWLLSDGAAPALPGDLAERLAVASEDGDITAQSRYLAIGEPASDNRALVAIDLHLRDLPEPHQELFVRVQNASTQPHTSTVSIFLDDEFVDAQEMIVPGRSTADADALDKAGFPGQASLSFQLPADARGLLRVSLREKDNLPTDNELLALLEPAETIRVLLVTPGDGPNPGNIFLETVLGADTKEVAFDTVVPATYEQRADAIAQENAYDLILFDRWAPRVTPTGATAFLGVLPNLPDLKPHPESETAYAPMVVDWSRTHPLMINLALLDRLRILKAHRVQPAGAWHSLIHGLGLKLENAEQLSSSQVLQNAPEIEAPLLLARITEQRRTVVLTFDIWETERWPWRVSFPLFVKNLVRWLARPEGSRHLRFYATGETITLHPPKSLTPKQAANARITDPRGGVHRLTIAAGQLVYFSQTAWPGLYTLDWGNGQEEHLAVNLLNDLESDNATRTAVTMGAETLSAKRGRTRRNRPWWPWLVALAMIGLAGEWYLYNKRILG